MTPAGSAAHLEKIAARLRSAGCVFAEDEAAVLLADPVAPAELERRIQRRIAGEPLEYVVGWAEFCGLRVTVAPGVFVPRRRTAVVVSETLRLLRPSTSSTTVAAPVLLDLCCGAGAIGAAVLKARPDARVHAADIDPDACACTRATLASLLRSWSSSVAADASSEPKACVSRPVPAPAPVFLGDLYTALPASLRGTIDVMAVNAPYVPTDDIRLMPHEAKDRERLATLDGGSDGLALHRRVAADARTWLARGGHVVIETSRRQSAGTAAIFEARGFDTSIVRDEKVDGTAVVAQA